MKLFSFVVATLMLASCASQMQAKKDTDLNVSSIDREKIRQVIRNDINSIRKCYEDGLKRDENLEGNVLVEWDIGTGGKVVRAKIREEDANVKDKKIRTTLTDGIVRACLVTEISKLTFPEPPTSAEVTVIFPFYFKK